MQGKHSRAGLLLSGAMLMMGMLGAQAQSFDSSPDVKVAVTYAAAHADRTDGTDFWLQGGSFTTNASFYRGLGLAASVTGLHSAGDTAHAPLDLLTVAFGPSYTLTAGGRFSVFGEALLGEAHGFNSVFGTGSGPQPSLVYGTTDSANALALQTGGGADVHLTRHLGVRILQVDYLRTQLPNGGSDLQNNLRFSAGLVLRSR